MMPAFLFARAIAAKLNARVSLRQHWTNSNDRLRWVWR
jgi:hypothetical protein